MDEAIKRTVKRCFPELTAGYHLPMFGRVESIRETPDQGAIADPYRPYYAIDVQIIDEHGEPDTDIPLLRDVPLSLPVAGQEMGHFAYPENGATVEIAFAYGSPNHPFIRGILPHNLTLPRIERGEQLWQHNPESFHRVDKNGNWEKKTDLDITEESRKRLITAVEAVIKLDSETQVVTADSVATIGAMRKLKALGGIEQLSGGRFDIAALENLNLTTQAILTATADLNQRYKSPQTWLGSNTENVLGLLSELMQLVIDLASTLSSHTHSGVQTGAGNTAAPVQASTISTVGSDTGGVKGRLDGITE